MNIYLFDNKSYPLDRALKKALKNGKMKFNCERLSLSFPHKSVVPLLASKAGGIVFLPPIWVDLVCVKAVQEIQTLAEPFETVICGPAPEPSDLIVAFNEGLSSYLESPLEADELKCVLSRTTARYKERLEQARKARLLEEYESNNLTLASSTERFVHDRLLAKALHDSLHRRGPLLENIVQVLLVSSSRAQRKKLEAFLKGANIAVKGVGSIKEAEEAAQTEKYAAIVSDSLLPDGEATALATRIRNSLDAEIPRFVVWTASPEKAKELLSPENAIDDVVLKPDPDAGMDSILLSIIIGLYQTKVG